jgi:hypothetical protein
MRRAPRTLAIAVLGAAALSGLWAIMSGGAHAISAQPGSIIGWVEIQPASQGKDHVTIVGRALALDAAAGQFKLVVSRSGRGGVTDARQSGAFDLRAGESKVLSSTSINVSQSESLVIELKLFSDSKEISSVVLRTAKEKAANDI